MDEEMAKWLTTLIALPEDSGTNPSTYTASQTVFNSSSSESGTHKDTHAA